MSNIEHNIINEYNKLLNENIKLEDEYNKLLNENIKLEDEYNELNVLFHNLNNVIKRNKELKESIDKIKYRLLEFYKSHYNTNTINYYNEIKNKLYELNSELSNNNIQLEDEYNELNVLFHNLNNVIKRNKELKELTDKLKHKLSELYNKPK
jgi:hypothetical protein